MSFSLSLLLLLFTCIFSVFFFYFILFSCNIAENYGE